MRIILFLLLLITTLFILTPSCSLQRDRVQVSVDICELVKIDTVYRVTGDQVLYTWLDIKNGITYQSFDTYPPLFTIGTKLHTLVRR